MATIKEYESSEGKKIENITLYFEEALFILNENYRELIETIDEFEMSGDILITDVDINNYFMRVSRTLHNYLAIMSSLKEFLKTLNNSFNKNKSSKTKKFMEFYEEEIKRLVINPRLSFLAYLRDYIQHYRLPFAKISEEVSRPIKKWVQGKGVIPEEIEFGEVERNRTLLIVKEDIIGFQKLDSRLNEFFKKYEKDIHLKPILEEINPILNAYYKKHINKIKEIFAEELTETDRLARELGLYR
ncbi:MAG: hypothetical protein PHW96_04650 [Candidatus Nanoarchaeia archaeon]|nr:hypothetical protein [Candidatus Nanoarchaeia archaeon]